MKMVADLKMNENIQQTECTFERRAGRWSADERDGGRIRRLRQTRQRNTPTPIECDRAEAEWPASSSVFPACSVCRHAN